MSGLAATRPTTSERRRPPYAKSAKIARSRSRAHRLSRSSTASHRGTAGRRPLRRGLVSRSSGLRVSLSWRTAHFPKLPSVARRTLIEFVCRPRAESSAPNTTTAAIPNALPAEPCKPWSSRAIESPSSALRDLSLEPFSEEVRTSPGRGRHTARAERQPAITANGAYFTGNRRVARSVPTIVVPVKPPASTALR